MSDLFLTAFNLACFVALFILCTVLAVIADSVAFKASFYVFVVGCLYFIDVFARDLRGMAKSR